MSIKPALTPEEWARLRTQDPALSNPECLDFGDDSLPCGHHAIVDGGLVCRHFECSVQNPLGLAALCLHGRISWEMVDALRTMAFLARAHAGKDDDYVIQEKLISHGSGKFGEYGRLTVGDLRQAEAVADLLEELLPPREP